MAFKTGDEEGKVDQKRGQGQAGEGHPEQGGDEEKHFSKSPFDFRDERWKLTPTPAEGNRLGDPLTYKVRVGNDLNSELATIRMFVPAIARIGFLPTFGVSRDAGSPISTLASTTYADILAALKRSSLHFDPTAVVVHMLALDSIYCAYDVAVRAYRALNTTDPDNAYLAKNLVEACGFNYEDLLANKPQLYFWFSTTRATLKKYVAPKNFAMIGAHRAMCTNAYRDSESAKSQLYVFTPDFLWSWAKVDTAGGLQAVELRETPSTGSDKLTYARFTKIFNDMLQALLNSTDFKDINASIRATYADSDTYTFDMPGVDDTLPLVIDEIVLNSLLNASTLGEIGKETANTFAPTDTAPNTFIIKPKVPYTNKNLSHIINCINDCPTSESMVSNMRWHVSLDSEGTAPSASHIDVLSCGTEVITRIYAHALNDECPFLETSIMGNDVKITEFYMGGSNSYELTNMADPTESERYIRSDFSLLLAQAFRWRPVTCVTRWRAFENDPSHPEKPLYTVFSTLATDWNYQATVSAESLAAWHTALLFSACGL